MRKYVALVLLAALATLVFAPAAMAQQMDDDNMGNDDNMMMEDDQMVQDDMMSSASASAMSSATSSASASPMSSASAMEDEMSSSAMMSASASSLPKTGGTPLLPLLSAAVLAVMVGSGIVAARLVRSNS